MARSRAQDSVNRLPSVLVVYTGGTFGMERGRSGLKVAPMEPDSIRERILWRMPELRHLARCKIDILMNRDSAHIGPEEWIKIARHIQSRWKKYDGVVILHGTDTLSYTASALSFLLRPCLKPVILTGAQIPLAAHLTDARRNFISAVEIAGHGPRPMVNQVLVFFDDKLFQGNRTRKLSASDFGAFDSPYEEPLASIGTEIRYHKPRRQSLPQRRTSLAPTFSKKVLNLVATPAFPGDAVAALLPQLDGIVLSAFPSGTAPSHDARFMRLLTEAQKRAIPILIVSERNPSAYEAGRALLSSGAIWARQMTSECAFVKMSLILGQKNGRRNFKKLWEKNLAQEF